MQTMIVEIDTSTNATYLANFLKTLPYIKSVATEKSAIKLSAADWVKPGRPATDDELDQIIIDIEKDDEYPIEKARKITNRWIRKNLK